MRALIPVAAGNEDIELVSLTDVLARGGIDVILASVEEERRVRLMQGLRIEADCLLVGCGRGRFRCHRHGRWDSRRDAAF